jgi:hypothetical protein
MPIGWSANSAGYFLAIIVIRDQTTAAAPWALLLIVRTFFRNAFTIAVWTGFHVCLSVGLLSLYASRGLQVSISDIEYEIKPGVEAAANIRYPHQQFAPKQAVTEVRRFIGKIELRGQ